MPVCLPESNPRRFARTAAVVLGALVASSALAQDAPENLAGAYLAAGVAESLSDFGPAAAFYDRALQTDPANPALLQGALAANIGLGDLEKSAALAQALLATGTKSHAETVALVAADAKAGDFAGLLKIDSAQDGSAAVLLDLSKGWAQLGLGRMSDASATFDKVAKTKGLEAFGLYHKALALAAAGDFEGADEILSGRASGTVAMIRRGLIARLQILSQLEKNPEAVALIDKSIAPGADVEIDDLRRRLAAGEPIPFDIARNAGEGIAEVFFTLASAVNGQTDDEFTLMHARAASYLRPDLTEAVLLTGELLQNLGQIELARSAFAQVSPDSPQYYIAAIGLANATYAAGDKEAGLAILKKLAKTHGQILAVQIALGDGLRRTGQFAAAVNAYDAAINMVTEPGPEHWVLFYSRGVSEERSANFAAAEADLRLALTLSPDNPDVLNYLGYSLVDRGEKLEEALGMLQRAAAEEPNSGAIQDSLGWAYYRLGRYAEALGPQEKAARLDSGDPVVNDHLGDIYWAVGRRLEAQYQWRRALSFNPDPKDSKRIQAKLDKGLDAVLAAEGAPPLKPLAPATND